MVCKIENQRKNPSLAFSTSVCNEGARNAWNTPSLLFSLLLKVGKSLFDRKIYDLFTMNYIES